ncbi:hypothetical protein LAZ67_14003443 [Cordylochernes scorpioides]|uniref:DUF5641 domain-containing protein n=1 Tax=Cordylochernes scorpioides TaxID=51811 RepID=A0ABY6LA72_9ARAC|nr:hypothetical protein LAZ67_14003443 [Cordylochernes scorpioides]
MSSHLDVMCTKRILDRGGSSESPTVQDETIANLSTSPNVLLPTLRVAFKGNRTEKTARAIIDTGSQRSYILHSTAMEMEYEQSGREFFRHSLFGGSSTDVDEHEVYTIHLSDINNSYRCEFEALGQPLICGSIPLVCPRSFLEGSEELDVSDLMRDRIEVLIGADIAGKLLTDAQRRISSGLVAIRTKLGWTVMGKIPPTEVKDDTSSLCVTTLLTLDLENLWKLDAIGVSDAEVEKKNQSLQAEMEEHFAHTTTRDIEERYQVALPWVQDKERIPTNRDLAENQLSSVRRKLEEVGDMKEYGQIFEECINQGLIEYSREDKLDGVHNLPHRPVYKRNSQTSKIRPVFNASARKRDKHSLNDCPDNGTNFRGMANTLKKIDFSRLKCDPTLKNITWKFIPPGASWWGGWWERLIGMMKQLLFRILGQTSLGYEELSTVMCDVESLMNTRPLTYLTERFCIEYFGFLRQETRRLKTTIPFKVGDMVLIGQESLKRLHWPLARIIQLYPGKDGLVRVAKVKTSSGFKMDKLKKDCDLRSFAKKMEPGKVTRRKILSAAHSLFDPIGFTCPFTIIPKMLLQEKCLIQKAGWETDLSEDISRRFNAWLSQLTEVDKLKIPRCVVQSQDRRTWTLHVFMDSSNAAFAVCAYLRSGFPGSVQVQLLMARSRVAPMKNTTIPRLELVACEIGSRLTVHIKSMMEFEDIPITLWTDSTTALAWIKRDMNCITDWRHVPGKENPADIPSRGASISQLITTRWWEGPTMAHNVTMGPTMAYNGNYEIVKQLLRSVLGSACVTNEELQPLLCDVEAVVNNRPLTYVSEDDYELAPLTPNKLINNCGSSILPEADEVERDSMKSKEITEDRGRRNSTYRKRSKEKDFMAIRKSGGGATWGRWTRITAHSLSVTVHILNATVHANDVKLVPWKHRGYMQGTFADAVLCEVRHSPAVKWYLLPPEGRVASPAEARHPPLLPAVEGKDVVKVAAGMTAFINNASFECVRVSTAQGGLISVRYTRDLMESSQSAKVVLSWIPRRVKAKTSLEDYDVPIDDTSTKPLFTPQKNDTKVLGTMFQDFDRIFGRSTSDPCQYLP